MTAKTQNPTLGDILKHEYSLFDYTREVVTLLLGIAYKAGSVLGKITEGTPTAAAMVGTGNATITVPTKTLHTQIGAYVVKNLTATTFTVVNPNGDRLADGAAGAYVSGEINFTWTAGGTPAVAGDTITITVPAGSGKYTLSADGTGSVVDGSQVAAGMLLFDTDATSADQTAVILKRGPAIVAASALTYDATVTAGAKTTTKNNELAALGIIPRTTA